MLLRHRAHPGVQVYVRPCLRRRLRLVRSPRATRSEMRAWTKAWSAP